MLRKGFRGMHIIIRALIYTRTLDCEQSLIFLCTFTKAKHVSRNKQGRKPEKKKIRDC